MKNDNAKAFVTKWTGRGNEKQETQQYWNEMLYRVLDAPSDMEIQYEKPVKINGQTKFIDAYIPETRTLIEQKSLGIDLMKAELQSDGAKLTPFEQGRRYGGYLSYDEQPRWIIDCNFEEIRVHDMKKPGEAPEIIYLKDLEKDYTRLGFLLKKEDEHIQKEMEVSVKAGEIVGVLYDKLYEQFATPEAGAVLGDMYSKMLEGYDNPDDEHVLQSLNKLCVRIVFCLYAEDAGLFGNNTHAFHDYMDKFNGPARFRNGLKELFSVLNQKPEERDRFLDPELAAFPYVNGGLFADEDIEYPFFTDEIVNIILEKASAEFDWSDISPTIFGAIFESTLNQETRRSGGMHYTAIENIHKVIDPLFLNELKAELEEIKAEPVERTRERKLRAYQDKLASLNFLDPAAGSGNFLTETYISLRRLENQVIEELQHGQITMAYGTMPNPVKVSIHQFYGIEINDFACSVAQTAMWIAEAKMMKETEAIVKQHFDFFPLKSNSNMVEGNALRIDWETVCPKDQLSYIVGNPPFVGYSLQSKEQKEDILELFKGDKKAGKLDYVSGWYKKAANLMKGTDIHAALVSTNSITQGEQVALLWENLMEDGLTIDFAYRTFIWDSEATLKAHVHCVIIGFSYVGNTGYKRIFDGNKERIAKNINAYLTDAENVFVESRTRPLCDVPQLLNGGKPTEGGYLILTKEEKEELLKAEPQAAPLIRPYMMGKDFIQRTPRFCLWMPKADPSVVRQCPYVLKRIEQVKDYRLKSPKKATQKKAETPMLFDEVRECEADYVAIPKVSSERRRYIPIDFLKREIIPGDKLFMIPGSSIYHFGILTSNVHMAWMRTVAGRLKSDYSYSNTVVYNNFPWPTPTDEQKAKIEKTAQGILDARALYPDSSLADLYDELTMPIELRKAHQANDRAVMEAYGFDLKMTEQECVAELMKLYQELTKEA